MTDSAPPLDLAVIGAGVSGLTLARDVVRARPGWRVQVFESEDRPGGTMRSDRVEGCVCEWGPNGFLTNVDDTLELSRELGLGDRMLTADPGSERRFLWVRGRLRALPTGPAAFLGSDLLTLRGRMRVLMEPFQPRASGNGEDTVQAFARRRIGREAASVLVDAMVSGVYGGDPAQLSLLSSFPKMAKMEADHGSLMRAMAARGRSARAQPGNSGSPGKKSGSPFGPGGALTSFDDGMEVLIRTLAEGLGERLTTGAEVRSLAPESDGFRIELTVGGNPEAVRARRVVVATPSHVGRGLLSASWPELAACLGEIPYASLTVACLVYRRSQISHPLDGFGFLVPRGQGLRILGSLWTGSIFPDHVEGDTVLLRSMIGGARDPEATLLSEGRTVDLVHGELERVLGGIEGRPQEARLFRWAKGIPQYVVGHQDRLRMIDGQLQQNPGLYLVGNAYRGIGVNDCVREARGAAHHIVADPASASRPLEASSARAIP